MRDRVSLCMCACVCLRMSLYSLALRCFYCRNIHLFPVAWQQFFAWFPGSSAWGRLNTSWSLPVSVSVLTCFYFLCVYMFVRVGLCLYTSMDGREGTQVPFTSITWLLNIQHRSLFFLFPISILSNVVNYLIRFLFWESSNNFCIASPKQTTFYSLFPFNSILLWDTPHPPPLNAFIFFFFASCL